MELCTATLSLAFAADPAVRWLYPSAAQFLEYFPGLVRDFGGRAFGQGTAHVLGGFIGWALWLPPGTQPDEEALGDLIATSVAPELLPDAFSFLEQMGKHHPREEHWYLPMMGVDPLWQGKRQGSRLLRHALERIDAEHGTAYLEATSVRSVLLYQRHGFEIAGKIQAGKSPAIYPMVRRPFGK